MEILAQLDPYPAHFARVLFAAYPDWAARAVVDPDPTATPRSLLLDVPSPAEPTELLTIRAADFEVTVDLPSYGGHRHYTNFADTDPVISFAQALEAIASFVSGAQVIAIGFRDDKEYGPLFQDSQLIAATDQLPDLGTVDRIATFSWTAGFRPMSTAL